MGSVEQDTIVAISTPVGRGGIGIVRVSGARAREVVGPMVRLRGEWAAGRVRFAEVLDLGDVVADPTHAAMGLRHEWGTGSGVGEEDDSRFPLGMTNKGVLDEAVVTWFAAPHSYTGEDVVEVAMHGAPVLLEYFVRACCANGARLAEPGEFTQRAFLAGRIDLTQAEAVDDLIGSSTLEQARVAARQMGGGLARVVGPVKARLVGLIAALEAGIDFAEDDIDVMAADAVAGAIAEVRGPLVELARSFAFGRVVRDGFTLALVGRPNAGKSSVFNRLVERERSIVTAAPGTTRDTVSERVSLAGIPVELIDTAGLRRGEALDEAEVMGIARSREAMAEADVVVLVVDGVVGVSAEDREVMRGGRVIVAWNKWDLVGRVGESGQALPDNPPFAEGAKDGPPGLMNGSSGLNDGESGLVVGAVRTSAVTGEGIGELRAAIVAAVGGSEGLRESGMLTNLRQHQAVEWAVRGLDAAAGAMGAGIPHEMVLLDLYEALRGLDSLTGVTSTEDVLRLIFSKFCIGK